MSPQNENVHIPTYYASRTDVGCVREHNEDSLAAQSPLFIVADGMGGHEAGEVASSIAIATMLSMMPETADAEALAESVIAANKAVIAGAENGTGRLGMGTTITAALAIDNELIIAQVGDSRAYLLHNGELTQITRDHSLVADLIEQGRITEEEARYHPQRSVITRALGSDPEMQPDIFKLNIEPGDKLMLCSDGLSGMVSDKSIAAILRTNISPVDACNTLVNEAIAAGGLDNVSVIVVDLFAKAPGQQATSADAQHGVVGSGASKASGKPSPNAATAALQDEARQRRKGRRGPLLWIIAFVVVVALAIGGVYAYAQNSYYLITENGYVSVYKGLVGDFAGIKLSWPEEKTDIEVSKLAPTTASRLAQGIAVNSLEEANNLLGQYRQTAGMGLDMQESTSTAANEQQG